MDYLSVCLRKVSVVSPAESMEKNILRFST